MDCGRGCLCGTAAARCPGGAAGQAAGVLFRTEEERDEKRSCSVTSDNVGRRGAR
ncbi:MAG: hypothetical protein ACPIOQ_36400 [Promethearchaeia archaeon]